MGSPLLVSAFFVALRGALLVCPDALRGRAFAPYNAARNAAELGALGAGGVLVALIEARAAPVFAGAIPLAVGLLALLLVVPKTTTRRELYAHVQG